MKAVRLSLAIAAALLAAPAAASAASVTVTGDDGNPIPINATAPTVIRNVDVQAVVTVAQSEGAYYTSQVLGPDGVATSTPSSCRPSRHLPSYTNYADYRGNGIYRVVVRFFSTSACTTATGTQTFLYAINAGTGLTPPTGTVLTRLPNSFSTITHKVPVALNPGAIAYEIRYARGGVIGPDGAISGPSAEAFLDRTTGLADARFTEPGGYVMVARIKHDDYYTPWSAPISFTVKAPFDLSSVAFPDARGPSYKLRGQLRDKYATGRVTVHVAKGRKGGKFRRLGRTSKIGRNGRFTMRFRIRKTGIYRLRYTYKGSALVTPGRVTEQIRIRRRVFFPG
jgi:hypothetical protein